MTRRAARLKMGLAAGICLGLMGCTAQLRNHGYVPPEEDLQQIVPGIDTRATVEDVVGVPSTSGVLEDSGYYYIESRVRTYGWQRPEVVDRTIVAITFSSDGVVQNIESYGLQDGRVVPLARRITESADSNISFIRQLFGNIGGLSAEELLSN